MIFVFCFPGGKTFCRLLKLSLFVSREFWKHDKARESTTLETKHFLVSVKGRIISADVYMAVGKKIMCIKDDRST